MVEITFRIAFPLFGVETGFDWFDTLDKKEAMAMCTMKYGQHIDMFKVEVFDL